MEKLNSSRLYIQIGGMSASTRKRGRNYYTQDAKFNDCGQHVNFELALQNGSLRISSFE